MFRIHKNLTESLVCAAVVNGRIFLATLVHLHLNQKIHSFNRSATIALCEECPDGEPNLSESAPNQSKLENVPLHA
jgi:hypothetical protein